MLDLNVSNALALLAACAFGFMAHVFAKVGELRESDKTYTALRYLGQTPYKTAGKFALLAFSALALADAPLTWQLLTGAAGIGYASDSGANHAARKIGQ